MSTDFSSLDRLMELGMSMSLATQMVNTMNHVMNQSMVAGVNAGTTGSLGPAAENADTPVWYVVVDNAQAGPLSAHEVTRLVGNGHITPQTLVWRPGMTAWQPARAVPAVNKILLLARP